MEVFYQLLIEISNGQLNFKKHLHEMLNYSVEIADCFDPDALSEIAQIKQFVMESNSLVEQLIGVSTMLLEALHTSSQQNKYEKFYRALQKYSSASGSALVKFDHGSREQMFFNCIAQYYLKHRRPGSSVTFDLLVTDDLLASLMATNTVNEADMVKFNQSKTNKDVVLLSILIGRPDWPQRLVAAQIQSGLFSQLDDLLPGFQQFLASNFDTNLTDTRAQLLSNLGDSRREARNLLGEALDLYFCINYDSLALTSSAESSAQRLQDGQQQQAAASAGCAALDMRTQPAAQPVQRSFARQTAEPRSMEVEEPQPSLESAAAAMPLAMSDKADPTDEDDQEAAESGRQQMRVYQEELAGAGVAGLNCVIVAPTGSGKTLVSIRIAAARLSEDNEARVCFLADRKHLVEQQYEAFKAQLPARFRSRIACITGGEGERAPLSFQLREHSVLILSTQLLLNSLNDKSEDGLNGDLTKFRLIIFDECHHCAKEHPSNKIMEFYFQLKERQQQQASPAKSRRLPQIVGLTASPGTGQAHRSEEAISHVIRLCAGLDCQRLVTVRSCADSLHNHVINPGVRLHSTGRKHVDVVRHCLDLLMDRAEQGLVSACQRLGLLPPSPPARSSFLYTNFCGDLRSKLVARSVEVAAAWKRLHHCNVATLLWSLFRSTDAVSYIEEHLCDPNVLKRSATCELDAELRELLQQRLLPQMRAHCQGNPAVASRSPALLRLREILVEQFQRQADSRALVFVQQRCFTGVVKNYLDSEAAELTAAGVRVGVMTGANASGDSGGLTQTSQSDLLAQFRRGALKILVSTSVTEEGLDVQKCNAVVRFCHVTNEIAMVQSRGRGRAEGSVYHVIVPDEMNWLGDKELLNQARDGMMTEAVAHLSQLSAKEFCAKVQEEQQMLRLEARQQRELRAAQADANRGALFDIRCIQCERPLTSSEKLRLAQSCHRLALDAELLTTRLSARRECASKTFTDYSVLGVALLCQCGAHVANLCRFKELPFAELKIQQLKFINVKTKETHGPLKKWKLVKRFLTEKEMQNEDMISWAGTVPDIPENLINLDEDD